MRQALHSLHIQTDGKGLVEITKDVASWLREQKIATGLLTIFCRHTSASLLIQENADPDVRTDLESFFEEIAPEDRERYVLCPVAVASIIFVCAQRPSAREGIQRTKELRSAGEGQLVGL